MPARLRNAFGERRHYLKGVTPLQPPRRRRVLSYARATGKLWFAYRKGLPIRREAFYIPALLTLLTLLAAGGQFCG